MKAIVYHRYGMPDVLKLKEVEKPTPKENEVLIRVHAASINSWDWDLLRGRPLLFRLLFGLQKPKLPILGADIAGTVVATGKNVTQFKTGDEVFGDISGCHWGGFAEFVCADESVLALKPVSLTFEEAAAVPQAGVLALQGLGNDGKVSETQKVLINGAGGGVGTFAVQLLRITGAEVTVVDKAEKLDMLRALGADHVMDYTKEDFTRNGKRYDLILDVVGHDSVFKWQRILNQNGRYVMAGGTVGRIFQVFTLGGFIGKSMKKKIGLLIHKPGKNDLNLLASLIDSGKIKPVVDRIYPLEQVPEAMEYYGSGKVAGKIIIKISP